MKERRYKEWSRRKKGVSGIIAATFLFAMIFTTGFAYFMFVQYNYQLQHQAAIERNQMDFEQSLEQFEVTGVITADNKIGVKVNNTGPIPIEVVSIFVMDDTGKFYRVKDSFSMTVNSGEVSGVIDTTEPYVDGTQYVIKVVTKRGNTEVGFYPPITPSYITVNALYATLAKGIGSIHIEFASLRWLWAERPYYLPSQWGWAPDGVDQSGYLAGGYNGHATVYNEKIIFMVNVTNYDPNGRDIYLNGNSELRYLSITGGGSSFKLDKFPLAKGYSLTNHTVIKLGLQTVELPFNKTVTIYFGDTDTSIASNDVLGPFLSLFGKYSDGKPYAQTLPFEGTVPISKDYYVRLYDTNFNNPNYQGSAGEKVSIEFSSSFSGKTVKIGLIKRNGIELLLNTISVPSSSPYRVVNAFTIPDSSELGGPGYYVFYVSDGRNIAYATFNITG